MKVAIVLMALLLGIGSVYCGGITDIHPILRPVHMVR